MKKIIKIENIIKLDKNAEDHRNKILEEEYNNNKINNKYQMLIEKFLCGIPIKKSNWITNKRNKNILK